MKIFNKINKYMIVGFASLATLSCTKDLDTSPIDSNINETEAVYSNPESYEGLIAKMYGTFTLSGQEGPAGKPDITGLDEGHSQYLRAYFYAQEWTTDEAVGAWGNEYDLSWGYSALELTASNGYIYALYSRLFVQVAYTNDFLKQTTDAKLESRGLDGDAAFVARVKEYRNEARFIRALSYWHAIDIFGDIPFATEDHKIGTLPSQKPRAEVYQFIVDELTAIIPEMKAARSNQYGRADQAAAQMLLAKLYLNSKVYTGTENTADYTKAIALLDEVIGGGYTLEPNYKNNFGADNDKSPEVIWAMTADGQSTKTWGGMTFILNASYHGNWYNVDGFLDQPKFFENTYSGLGGGWGGQRTTTQFRDKFEAADNRALFLTKETNGAGEEFVYQDQEEIDDVLNFLQGVGVHKWTNLDRNGVTGIDGSHPDTDFPYFRLADAYLMYAELVARGGSAGTNNPLTLVNEIRTRAGVALATPSDITNFEWLLDEMGRELYWEGHRRTDLIRFDKFTKGYNWPWKGGVKEGKDVDNKYNLFPIPTNDLGANPNLTQNPLWE